MNIIDTDQTLEVAYLGISCGRTCQIDFPVCHRSSWQTSRDPSRQPAGPKTHGRPHVTRGVPSPAECHDSPGGRGEDLEIPKIQ